MDEDQYIDKLAGGREKDSAEKRRRLFGRVTGISIVAAAVVLACLVFLRMTYNPRTQDGSLGAHYIGMAPEVDGRIISLNVADNACVHTGQLLAEIDPRPYQYSLESALSNQAKLEEDIAQEERSIRAARDQVFASKGTVENSRLNVLKGNDGIREAADQLTEAHAALATAQANLAVASLNLERNTPLAERNYLSKQDYDELRATQNDAAESVRSAEAQVRASEANQSSAADTEAQDAVSVTQSVEELHRSQNEIPLLGTLLAQRPAYRAAVDQARLNLGWTKVYAPFSGCVTSMNIARGEYAKPGSAMFTLIDEDSWYVRADYGEQQLRYITLA